MAALAEGAVPGDINPGEVTADLGGPSGWVLGVLGDPGCPGGALEWSPGSPGFRGVYRVPSPPKVIWGVVEALLGPRVPDPKP
ncbi:hypothetical protein DV515_00019881 [Chloebia gouldiae]|uniref:Uncharacterized protein n=1 Tax=Chloebia gouldiae TaxID=44316 RepID=A0A3L8Q401_CHLGU|nr:hypothetical protein DV515_00019881 [Chloebia gouldiae]